LYPGQFKYHLVPLRDEPEEVLEPYFDETVRFINQALASGGRVFVHCMKVSAARLGGAAF
jgi:protein-tyrosine phosphatase